MSNGKRAVVHFDWLKPCPAGVHFPTHQSQQCEKEQQPTMPPMPGEEMDLLDIDDSSNLLLPPIIARRYPQRLQQQPERLGAYLMYPLTLPSESETWEEGNGVIQGYGHDLQRPNVFLGLCTKAELVWFNVILYLCLCVIMQLDLSSVTTFVQYVCVLCIVPLSVWPCLYTSTAMLIHTLCTLTIKCTCLMHKCAWCIINWVLYINEYINTSVFSGEGFIQVLMTFKSHSNTSVYVLNLLVSNCVYTR